MSLVSYKTSCLDYLHKGLSPIVRQIQAKPATHQNRAKLVNRAIAEEKGALVAQLPDALSAAERQQSLIVIQYAITVVSLEYRHAVWPYEYMALSRRVGELWERFCSCAWEAPSRPGLQRISPPVFETVRAEIARNLLDAAKHDRKHFVSPMVEDLFRLVGDINMAEDQVFDVAHIPHVVDFKSGFGSNEKGNTQRLRTVGTAYRLWNHDTNLILLVRQEENNHYLEALKREGLWKVYCGEEAYSKIDELTGSRIGVVKEQIVDFNSDLSARFWRDLNAHPSDLAGYLRW